MASEGWAAADRMPPGHEPDTLMTKRPNMEKDGHGMAGLASFSSPRGSHVVQVFQPGRLRGFAEFA